MFELPEKFVRAELKRAATRGALYCSAILGEEASLVPVAECPLEQALEAVAAHAGGKDENGRRLDSALKLLVELDMLPGTVVRELDIREPEGIFEEAAAVALVRRRLRRGWPVAAQHLALLGNVGASAVRMAIKDGPLVRAVREGVIAEDDRRVYVTAESATDWLKARETSED